VHFHAPRTSGLQRRPRRCPFVVIAITSESKASLSHLVRRSGASTPPWASSRTTAFVRRASAGGRPQIATDPLVGASGAPCSLPLGSRRLGPADRLRHVCFAPAGAADSGPSCMCQAGGVGAGVLTGWRSRREWFYIRVGLGGTMLVSIIVRRRTSWNLYGCWIALAGAARRRRCPAFTRADRSLRTRGCAIHQTRRPWRRSSPSCAAPAMTETACACAESSSSCGVRVCGSAKRWP
jgi:hypothetical protein